MIDICFHIAVNGVIHFLDHSILGRDSFRIINGKYRIIRRKIIVDIKEESYTQEIVWRINVQEIQNRRCHTQRVSALGINDLRYHTFVIDEEGNLIQEYLHTRHVRESFPEGIIRIGTVIGCEYDNGIIRELTFIELLHEFAELIITVIELVQFRPTAIPEFPVFRIHRDMGIEGINGRKKRLIQLSFLFHRIVQQIIFFGIDEGSMTALIFQDLLDGYQAVGI